MRKAEPIYIRLNYLSKGQTIRTPNTPSMSDRKVRIVHISDTHGRHNQYLEEDLIPDGDILVHSGDFCCSSLKKLFRKGASLQSDVAEMNEFFGKLPHKHKIFVAGNHEMSLGTIRRESSQSLLKNCTYLQDSKVVLEGLTFYGSPWNGRRITTHAQGFSLRYGSAAMRQRWASIPDDVDIMVTHTPAHGIMDMSVDKSLFKKRGVCDVCSEYHPGANHWGCVDLRRALFERVKPALHLHGHTHSENGVVTVDGITVSNAAMKAVTKAHVFDFYLDTKQVVQIQ